MMNLYFLALLLTSTFSQPVDDWGVQYATLDQRCDYLNSGVYMSCAVHLKCTNNVCKINVKYPNVKGLGADCTRESGNTCAPGLECEFGKCDWKPVLRKENEACGGWKLPGCEDGLWCFVPRGEVVGFCKK
jgi:hypothetical protein